MVDAFRTTVRQDGSNNDMVEDFPRWKSIPDDIRTRFALVLEDRAAVMGINLARCHNMWAAMLLISDYTKNKHSSQSSCSQEDHSPTPTSSRQSSPLSDLSEFRQQTLANFRSQQSEASKLVRAQRQLVLQNALSLSNDRQNAQKRSAVSEGSATRSSEKRKASSEKSQGNPKRLNKNK